MTKKDNENLNVSSQIQFTAHAAIRLRERSELSELDIGHAIDGEKAALVSVERGTGLYSYLLYSESEDKFLVIVFDNEDSTVVTIIPVEYWNNLQKDRIRFGNDTEITNIHKFKAIKAANPNHTILQNPPFCGRQSIFFSIRLSELGKIKTKKIGSLFVSDVLKKNKIEMQKKLADLLSLAFSDSDIFRSRCYLCWSLSKNFNKNTDKLNIYEIFYDIKLEYIYDAIYTDICKRQENSNRYVRHFE
jgi:hypothetical protein